MHERVELHMRDSDAFTWYMEDDPTLRSTVCVVFQFEKSPDWDTLVDRVDRSSRVAPGFRHRVVAPPMRISTPRWVVDPEFDISWHLRRFEAPPPKTLGSVLDFARKTAMAGLDKARPLWEYTLIEGLEGGRAALVMKLHHSLTDGVGGMEIAHLLFDLTADPGDLGPMPDEPPAEHLSKLDLVRDALSYDWSRLFEFGKRHLAEVPADMAAALTHPASTVADTVDTFASVGRTVRPINDTLSPVMTARGFRWHYDLLEFDLADLKRSVKVARGSLNAGFLGGITGGLRRYHELHGDSADALRVTMPISIRKADDPPGGNRITLLRLQVPVVTKDPIERMSRLQAISEAGKSERSLAHTQAIAGTLNMFPSGVIGGLLKHVDFIASNVAGTPAPIYLAGARVTGFYPFGPTIGAALNVTLVSYCGRCYIGVNTDTDAIPDPDALIDCMQEGFDEVLHVGGDHAPVVFPTRAIPAARPGAVSAHSSPRRRKPTSAPA